MTQQKPETLRQDPATQQTTSAMELIVSISKPISSLGETLTVGHHRTKHPGRGAVAEAQADHPAHLLLCTLAKTGDSLSIMVHLSQDQQKHYRRARLNKAFSLSFKWKKTLGKSFFCTILIAEENQETERLLLNTSETSAEIGLTST